MKEEDDYDNQYKCIVCGSKSNQSISIKSNIILTSNICGHTYCKRCLDNNLLLRKTKFNCIKCDKIINDINLSEKTYDEIQSDIDTTNRKKIKLIFNKNEKDFSNINDYKEYEEMVEDIIYNLNNNIDIINTKNIINQYKIDNEKNILINNELNNQLDKLKDKPVDKLVDKSNILSLLKNQRLLPKVIKDRNAINNSNRADKSIDRSIHIAGGYDYIYYSQRNWKEIFNNCLYINNISNHSTDEWIDRLIKR